MTRDKSPANPHGLPAFCAARKPDDETPVLIEQGHNGYWEVDIEFPVEKFNATFGVSRREVSALVGASMFSATSVYGDPASYHDNGNLTPDAAKRGFAEQKTEEVA